MHWVATALLIAFAILGAIMYGLSVGMLAEVAIQALRGNRLRRAGFPFVGALLIAVTYLLSPLTGFLWIPLVALALELALGAIAWAAFKRLRPEGCTDGA